jgi:hypothetical protein
MSIVLLSFWIIGSGLLETSNPVRRGSKTSFVDCVIDLDSLVASQDVRAL